MRITPSTPDEVVVEEAAKRWGQSSPCVDDVLMRACPGYHKDHDHTTRYHRLLGRVCDAVGSAPVGSGGYDRTPVPEGATSKMCAGCDRMMHKQENECPAKWRARRYHSLACWNNRQSVLQPHQYEWVEEMIEEGKSVRELAQELGVPYKNLWHALKRRKERAA